jgi:chromosome segregation ATPase
MVVIHSYKNNNSVGGRMTKNINGTDVSECEFFKQNRGFDCYKGRNCTETNDCYFKQFKRLQEENKELKNKNNDLIEEIASGNIDIAILQKENEELKTYIQKMDKPEIKTIDSEIALKNIELQKENEELKARNANLRLNLATYDLPEIKKVLTDWRTGELDKKFKKLQKENEELKAMLSKEPKAMQAFQTAYSGLKKDNEVLWGMVKDYKTALEEIKNITEKLITEQPEYHSCYYKDECGDNCTPKKQSKVEYCCYENADKILTIIIEVLNDRY